MKLRSGKVITPTETKINQLITDEEACNILLSISKTDFKFISNISIPISPIYSKEKTCCNNNRCELWYNKCCFCADKMNKKEIKAYNQPSLSDYEIKKLSL